MIRDLRERRRASVTLVGVDDEELTPGVNASPILPSEFIDEDIDSAKLMQTIAHEIGHWVGVDDRPHPQNSQGGPQCPPVATTVMVTRYFTPTMNPLDCAWSNIPHTFDVGDLNQMRVR